MADEEAVGCARPTGGPVGGDPPADAASEGEKRRPASEETRPMIKVGQKAPDFTAPAYHGGTFTSVKLSDKLGQWVLLCFYPGDFTFV